MPSGIFPRKPHTEETKQKIRDKKKGIIPMHLVKYWTGRKQTPEHKAKTLKTLAINPHRFQKGQIAPMKGRKGLSGDKSPHWKGGITPFSQTIRIQRIKENGGFHTLGEWELLKKQYGNRCPMCLQLEPKIKLTKDHVIPISKGGMNNIENIQPLCVSCNSKKHDKLIDKIQVTNIN